MKGIALFILLVLLFLFTVPKLIDTSNRVTPEYIENINTKSNEAPKANNQKILYKLNEKREIILTGFDEDKDDNISFIIFSTPLFGTITYNSPKVIYTPKKDSKVDDIFLFKVFDGKEYSSAGKIELFWDKPKSKIIKLSKEDLKKKIKENMMRELEIDINTSIKNVVIKNRKNNKAPTVKSKSYTIDEDSSLNIALFADDVDKDPLLYFISKNVKNGYLTKKDNVVRYVPTKDYFGKDSFKFYVSDGLVKSTIATVDITISPINDLPVIKSQLYTGPKNEKIKLNVKATDIESKKLNLKFRILQQPVNGTINRDFPYTYTPNNGFEGEDLIKIEVIDETNGRSYASFIINILNQAPKSINQNITTFNDTPIIFKLKGVDPDGDDLHFAITEAPLFGVAYIKEDMVTYKPNKLFVGRDRVEFAVYDEEKVAHKDGIVIINIKEKSLYVNVPNIIYAEDNKKIRLYKKVKIKSISVQKPFLR